MITSFIGPLSETAIVSVSEAKQQKDSLGMLNSLCSTDLWSPRPDVTYKHRGKETGYIRKGDDMRNTREREASDQDSFELKLRFFTSLLISLLINAQSLKEETDELMASIL